MSSINQVILCGNVGKDVEFKTLDGGKKMARFSLATSEKYKRADGEVKENTTWHNIVVWGQSAEFCKNYVKKGDTLLINGKIDNRSYIDSQDVTKYVSEVVTVDVQIVRSKSFSGTSDSTESNFPTGNNTGNPSQDNNDDLPF